MARPDRSLAWLGSSEFSPDAGVSRQSDRSTRSYPLSQSRQNGKRKQTPVRGRRLSTRPSQSVINNTIHLLILLT